MKALVGTLVFALYGVPLVSAAQDAHNPVSDALRSMEQRRGKNLIEAAEDMPAEKYGFKPTSAQMSFGDVVVHLAEGNDYLCSTITGVAAPQRSKVAATDAKDKLVARLAALTTWSGLAWRGSFSATPMLIVTGTRLPGPFSATTGSARLRRERSLLRRMNRVSSTVCRSVSTSGRHSSTDLPGNSTANSSPP